MKELYRKDNWVLAIMDWRNYVIYDHTKPTINKKTGVVSYEYSYFGQIVQAIRELSRRLANDSCTDLKSWVGFVGDYYKELESLLSIDGITANPSHLTSEVTYDTNEGNKCPVDPLTSLEAYYTGEDQ
jgi:hypothetical protein